MKRVKSKRKRQRYIDDGHTVYDMSGLNAGKAPDKGDGTHLSPKERRAAIAAAFERFLPIFFGVLCCFGLAMLIIWLWLG